MGDTKHGSVAVVPPHRDRGIHRTCREGFIPPRGRTACVPVGLGEIGRHVGPGIDRYHLLIPPEPPEPCGVTSQEGELGAQTLGDGGVAVAADALDHGGVEHGDGEGDDRTGDHGAEEIAQEMGEGVGGGDGGGRRNISKGCHGREGRKG